MRTDRELLIECVKQLKHIDEIYDFEPLATTTSLIREVQQALNIPVVVGMLPKCEHKNITSSDGCDECLDCGTRNY